MTTEELTAARDRLETERSHVRALLGSVSGSATATNWTGRIPSAGDVADIAAERSARDDTAAERAMLQRRLAQIEAALARVDDGSYDRCAACDGPIGNDRLAALPFVTVCVEDQARQERLSRAS